MASTAGPRRTSNRKPNDKGFGLRFLTVTLVSVLLLAIAANLAFTLMQSRGQMLQAQYTSSEKLARLLEQQTVDSVNALELALQSTARALQTMPLSGSEREQAVHDLLAESIRNLPFVRAIWILDPDGNMIHDSERLPGKYNLADRDYFKVQRDDQAHGLYIEGPLVSKHGVRFIGASVRIAGRNGRFGGVVAAAFEPKHFDQFYNSIKQGDTGMVALLKDDGTTVLRVPGASAGLTGRPEWAQPGIRIPRTATDALFTTRSGIDGVERIYAYRRVSGRPLAVLVGIGEHEVLAAWRHMARAYSAATAIFLVALAVLGHLTLRAIRRRSELHEALVRSEADLAAAQRLSKTGSWTYEFSKHSGNWSVEMYAVLGMEGAQQVPAVPAFLSRIHPDDREKIEYALFNEATWCLELRTNPEHGPVRRLLSRGEQILDADGEVIGKAGTLQDVTERRAMDEKLALAARVFDRMQDGIVVTDLQGKILAVNRAAERITEYAEDEILEAPANILLSESRGCMAGLIRTLQAGTEWRGEIRGKRKGGACYPLWLTASVLLDAQSRQRGYVAVFTDLSDIKEANAQVTFLSFHDPLTRLPNRRLMLDRLQAELDRAGRDGGASAVMIVNMDRLQRVNETFGREAGDAVIVEIARRLSSALPQRDSVGRAAGDEFIVVLPQIRNTDEVITVAHRLLEVVTQPIEASGSKISVTASMGIAVAPQDGETAEDLLKNAATALAHAKQRRPNTMRFYEGEMNARAVRWTLIEQELRRAQPGSEIMLHYQPQVCLPDGGICGVEALMKWQSPALGSVSPAEFIPIAEDAGLIEKLGDWAIQEACRQAKAWEGKGIFIKSVAVNVSSHQFSSGRLLDVVEKALTSSRLDPSVLEIELTETALMQESEVVSHQVSALRRLGVRISLDDFGTGYSSLSYLSKLAFDKVKIDQGFVRSITVDKRSEAIAKATVALAYGLGMDVIAEGVENHAQLDCLRAIGCNKLQGYLISRPTAPEELERFYLSARTVGVAV